MKYIKSIHLSLGIVILLIFLYTGQLMINTYFVSEMEGMQRALYRVGHLYILLFALINLSIGSYFQLGISKLKRITQLSGTILIVIATFFIVYSFFMDLPTETMNRPHAKYGLYIILAGVLLHLIPENKASIKN